MSNEIAPADLVNISPEALEVANTYLRTTDIKETAETLGLEANIVSSYLGKREVKTYVDSVFLDVGYRNRFKLANTLDSIIESKLEELDEAEMTSTKDIADLLALAHKMRMEELKVQTDLAKAESTKIRNQTNVQINDAGNFGTGNYGELMKKLLQED